VLGLIGLGVLVTGAVMREVGVDMKRPDFPEDQALEMAADFNRQLRAHLGLPALRDTAPAPRPARPAGASIAPAPLLSTDNLGVALSGRF
jgi:hypothetical protein